MSNSGWPPKKNEFIIIIPGDFYKVSGNKKHEMCLMNTPTPSCFSLVTSQQDLMEYDHILMGFHNISFHWQLLITYSK